MLKTVQAISRGTSGDTEGLNCSSGMIPTVLSHEGLSFCFMAFLLQVHVWVVRIVELYKQPVNLSGY